MDSLFGAEGSLIVRFVVAFVIVLALIGRRSGSFAASAPTRVGTAAQRGRQPRLAVIDAAPVDGRRRLVLVRRDNVEHLLMIGGPSDIVVEQNIVRAVPVNAPRDVPVPRSRRAGRRAGPHHRRPCAAARGGMDAARARAASGLRAPRAARTGRARARPAPGRNRARPNRAPTSRRSARRCRRASRRSPRARSIPRRRAEPAGEPPDAALASMAQRLEAALRRPGEPRPAPPPVPAPDLALDAPPAAPENGEPSPDAKHPGTGAGASGAKSKSVLDSLEEEMASLLGRPPEKQ